MKRSLLSLILLVVVLGVPSMAFSQEFRNLELNPFLAGSGHTKSLYTIGFPQTIAPISGEFKYKNALRGGLRFNINTTGHWGEELFFSYEPNTAQIRRKTAPQHELDLGTRILNFGVNALYYINENEDAHMRPYLTFGVGGTMDRPTAVAIQVANDPLQGNLPGFSSDSYLALNYGFGFKQRLSKDFGFRLDVRGFVTRNPTFGLPRSSPDASAVVFPATGAASNLEVSVGMIIRLKK